MVLTTVISTRLTVCINFLFSLYNILLWRSTSLKWYLAISVYYVVLSAMRLITTLKSVRSGDYVSKLNAIWGTMIIMISASFLVFYLSTIQQIPVKSLSVIGLSWLGLYMGLRLIIALFSVKRAKKKEKYDTLILRDITLVDIVVAFSNFQRSAMTMNYNSSAGGLLDNLINYSTVAVIFVIGFVMVLRSLFAPRAKSM